MGIIFLIFFIFVVIGYTRRISKASYFRRRSSKDPSESSFNTINFFSLQNIANHNSFDRYTDHCSSDNCCDQSCSDNNFDCGASDGSGCD